MRMKKTFASVLIVLYMIYFLIGSVTAQAPELSPTPLAADETEADENAVQPPQIMSEAAILMDASTGQILYEKNMDRRMYPASITKIMTALLALENGRLDQPLTMSEEAVFSIERGSSHIALDTDEQITLEQALYGLSIASGNDAANGIAEAIGGSMDGFAELMNRRASQLGAEGSHFVNAHGLPDDEHYTTAHDMALIMREAVQLPDFLQLFSEIRYEIPPTNKQPETRCLNSANCLVNGIIEYDGIIASKTGYTDQAGHTLVTAANRNGRVLIAVVLKSYGKYDKYNDTTALFDYGYDHFRQVTIPASSIVKEVSGQNNEGVKTETVCYAAEDVSFYLHESLVEKDVSIEYDIPEQITEEESASAVLFINEESDNSTMYSTLAVSSLEITVQEELGGSSARPQSSNSSNTQDADINEDDKSPMVDILAKAFIAAGIILLILALTVIYKIWRRQRRRRKLERLRRKYGVSPGRVERNNRLI